MNGEAAQLRARPVADLDTAGLDEHLGVSLNMTAHDFEGDMLTRALRAGSLGLEMTETQALSTPAPFPCEDRRQRCDARKLHRGTRCFRDRRDRVET